MGIADLRREYNLTGLRRKDMAAEPVEQFQRWFAQATSARTSGRLRKALVKTYKALFGIPTPEQVDVNAMALATTDKDGNPSARMVLLKGVDARGFIFFTNYNSRKGQELAGNPAAALVFYWPELERQVCIQGTVAMLPPSESDAYFQSRPRGSRIAAWASNQSEVVPDRAALEERWQLFQARYPGDAVPRPPHWGGYVLAPKRVDFWQGRPNRLHDRFSYTRSPHDSWRLERLAP